MVVSLSDTQFKGGGDYVCMMIKTRISKALKNSSGPNLCWQQEEKVDSRYTAKGKLAELNAMDAGG